jgi:hypothetical protein
VASRAEELVVRLILDGTVVRVRLAAVLDDLVRRGLAPPAPAHRRRRAGARDGARR